MRICFILLAAVSAIVPATAADTPQDLEKLRGTWEVIRKVSAQEDYQPRDGYRIVIDGRRLTWKLRTYEDEVVSFRIDQTQKPKHLDLYVRDGAVLNKCIYDLDGDRLLLCIGHFGERRPRDFSGSESSTFLTLKRDDAVAKAK